MKYFFIVSFIMFLSTCNNVAKSAAQSKQDNSVSVNYSAISRGTYLKISITDSIISVSKGRKDKPIVKPITDENRKKFIHLISTINLDSLSLFKDPTQARFYDGAAIGALEITKNGQVYESSNFDHGAPPKEIEAIVKEILSISENIE